MDTSTSTVRIDSEGNVLPPRCEPIKCHWYKHYYSKWFEISEGDIMNGGRHTGNFIDMKRICLSCGKIQVKRINY